MASVAKEHLLTAAQMAKFVTDGFLLFDGWIPKELNDAVYAEQESGMGYWDKGQAIHEVFELPQVKGVLQGLVGQNPVYDHSALHVVRAKQRDAQAWHADSIIDARPFGFDVQAMYFSHDCPHEMGPTLVLPGSHLRRTNTSSIGRYKNIIGQMRLAGKAGTIGFLHHGIWHCAQPNQTDKTRYMFKLRLRPGEEQRGLFNLDGYNSPEVRNIINAHSNRWQGDEARLEHIQRAKLWRYVTGDDNVDVSFETALTRMHI